MIVLEIENRNRSLFQGNHESGRPRTPPDTPPPDRRRKNKNAAFPKEDGVLFDHDT